MSLKLFFITLIFSGLALPLLGENQPPKVWTLADLYHTTLRNNERLALSAEAQRKAEGILKETIGRALPELSFRHDTLWEEAAGNQRARTTQGALTLRETDLTGYRERAVVQAGKTLTTQRRWETERLKQEFLLLVAGAFYGVLEPEETQASTERLIQLTQNRLIDINQRIQLGRSRPNDALAVEVQLNTLFSQREEQARQAQEGRDLLSFWASVPVTQPLVPPVDSTATLTLEESLARAETRPDIAALHQAVLRAEAAVKVAQSHHLPSLDLAATAYPYRSAPSQDVNWSLGLGVSVPLWSWRAVEGEVWSAQADAASRRLEWSAARRQVAWEVRSAVRDWSSASRQWALAAKKVQAARKDYDLQLQDERRGLSTNLEVLESLDRLNRAELDLTQARLQMRLKKLAWAVAVGAPEEDLP